ncbi:MAG: shikimate kinase [Acidobacteriaceae bacterium]|nr:shikimate kinase [Acidobacteriaceae bacterium]MBV9441428.1 shikimate kinase [Acidobacteriaceae bacterium]
MTLKLKRTPGLFLVGFMASGKTTVGEVVAEALGWGFADTDREIEAEAGQSISAIFSARGEMAFRQLENQAIERRVRQIETGVPLVVALGGGAFTQSQNWELISNNGITVWLDCPLDTIHRRLGDDKTRPLAADRARMAELFESRRQLYARADFRVDVDCDQVDEIVARILRLPIF